MTCDPLVRMDRTHRLFDRPEMSNLVSRLSLVRSCPSWCRGPARVLRIGNGVSISEVALGLSGFEDRHLDDATRQRSAGCPGASTCRQEDDCEHRRQRRITFRNFETTSPENHHPVAESHVLAVKLIALRSKHLSSKSKTSERIPPTTVALRR
jgi:hypothetical protein